MLQIASTQSGYLVEQAIDTRTMKTALQKIITERLNEIGEIMQSDSFFEDPGLEALSEDNETTYLAEPVPPVPVITEPDVDADEPDFFNEGEE